MLTVDEIEMIRRAYYVEHKSIRAIAQEQRHHRRVVREAISGASRPPRRYRQRTPRARPLLDPVTPLIDAWLEADRAAPRKQRHTAKRVYDRLVAEHDYAGKERAVREYVQRWKKEQHGAALGFLPLAYAPGAEAQCDWGDALVRIAGVDRKAALFCIRLAYSLKPFVCAFPAARQECFFAGHEAAFALWGGVPHRITYDNLTSAVQKVLEGRSRTEQDAFVAFRGHHLFASHFCLPGQEGAHEKECVSCCTSMACFRGTLGRVCSTHRHQVRQRGHPPPDGGRCPAGLRRWRVGGRRSPPPCAPRTPCACALRRANTRSNRRRRAGAALCARS